MFQEVGINRVSLGANLLMNKLAVLERNHNAVPLEHCFELLSPIDSISMDRFMVCLTNRYNNGDRPEVVGIRATSFHLWLDD